MAYKRKGPMFFKSALKNYNNMSEYSTKAVKFGEDEAPTKQKKKSVTDQMTKPSTIPRPEESDYNFSGDLYKKPSIVASDERKKSVREQVGDYNTSIDEYRDKVKTVKRYRTAKNMIKNALHVPRPGTIRSIDYEDFWLPNKYRKQNYMDERGRIRTPHSRKKK